MKRSIIPAVLLSLYVLFGNPCPVQSQSTPQELADQLVSAVNEGEPSAVEALFHPATKAFYRNDAPNSLENQIEALMENTFSGDYNIDMTGIEEVEQYDLSTDTYTFLGIKLEFPKRPDMKLDIDQTKVMKNRQGREISVSSKGISEMIVKENGRWYIIRPNRFPGDIQIRQKKN